ncbi:MAG: S1 RNA-binding domain-containing protein [Dehalococcoidia bacterium]|nr:S1 RNA-binding domain-containing protein [Dehalococcoidia bacterium]
MSTDTAQPNPSSSELDFEQMDMGALLETEAAQPGQLRRGEIVEGMVMGASPDGLIVDVGTKTEAVIPQGEMLSLGVDGASKLKTGDTVRVMVLQPSSSEGHGIVSLDRARGEEGWDLLQERHDSGEIFEAQVTGHNRGGILVNIEGVNAFVPLSQVDSVRRDDPEAVAQLANLVGRPIKLKVIELNRKRNRVILSERAAMAEYRKASKDRVLEELQEGEIREGRVSSITDFGVFVDLGGADGLAHMTELTWERGKKAKDLFQVGDEVKAYVLKVDRENKKISLSLKRAQPEKWDNTVDRFVIGQILIGKVTKLMQFGAFVRLEGPVEGLIHISELSNRRIQHPKDVVKEGDIVPVKLVRIEKDRHRLGLSLRQARADAEAMGFAFDANGSVVDYPADVREQYGLPPRDESRPVVREPRTAQEAIERAVSRDPEPVSAFAHAFAQALENAEPGSPFVRPAEDGTASDTESVPESVSDTPASAVKVEETTAEAGAQPEASPEPTTDKVEDENAPGSPEAATVGTGEEPQTGT